ncbi:hypothetical protein ACPOL_6889 (plasmid) [Acidisarcina polymorpha]|uniref:Uncharacterized protein n=1 Tax=Acidisarcina polymorpha TaxID=2211140 RepID=A0A2Z5GBB5_9BACT|nr:hypothetical protein [Acidisarcina polymorpha]AXC16097.1 hypothetical protein ACPOL_6889 [Acidisarcina polymorpha]
MECFLSITRQVDTDHEGRKSRSPVTSVRAEADLDQDAASGAPDFFFGKLLDVTLGQIIQFKFAPGVEVGFRGKRYKFEELGKSGSFKLRKDW